MRKSARLVPGRLFGPSRNTVTVRNKEATGVASRAAGPGDMEQTGVVSFVESFMPLIEERRKRKRIPLHWPIRLFRQSSTPSVESTTENLTSNGFYCVSSEPFQLGEWVECIIAIPADSLGYSNAPVCLQCRSRVMRVENQTAGFGLGCYIESYDLLSHVKPMHRSQEP
jgi:hypothetical protein